MKVRVTKKLADFINKMAKTGELHIDTAEVRMFSPQEYRINVGDPFDAEYYGDYDMEEGKISAIQITYPPEYHAMPMFITSKELIAASKRFAVKTLDELKSMMKQIIEI